MECKFKALFGIIVKNYCDGKSAGEKNVVRKIR